MSRHFGFGMSRFVRLRAHGAETEISCARVLERSAGHLRFVDLSVLAPGAEIGLHTHARDNEELYIVVAGRGLMTLDDRQFEVGPGDVVINRPGGTHALCNTGQEELRLVVVEVAQPEGAIS